MNIVLIIMLWAIALVPIISLCNRWLPKWFCVKLSWHLAPKTHGFDGCSNTGICPRCGKSVLQDSQGNWF